MVDIRPAQARDREAVWHIFHDVVSEGTTYAYPSDTPRAEALRLWVEAPRACYVAGRDGEVLGTYYLKANQPGRGGHVCNAGYMVRANARRQGIGRAMCAHSLDAARRMGFAAMQYNLVVATNEAAIRLWTDMGFEIVGTLPHAFDHAERGRIDAHVMYRLL